MKNNIPIWIQPLIAIQKKELKSIDSRWIQLSTIGLDNSPRVRTVVFRGWSKNYEMEILTDQRSEKFKELKKNNNVEICWLFQKARCQFRFRGIAKIDMEEEAVDFWQKLSPPSRSLWAWPLPGAKYNVNSSYPLEIKDETSKPENFVLLKIEIFEVDQLLLQKPIHIRKHWIKSSGWIEERINP
mgnify:CR=1 FL=1|tara:strand:- start:1722 stop:2276 length:555 start_codon:yes stop_codon:yes gene_type:complete